MSAWAAEWGTVSDWSMVLLTLIGVLLAASALMVSIVFGRRQTSIARQARDDAARSAAEARRIADIEAGRDHRAAAAEIQLVDVVQRPNPRHGTHDDLVVIVKNTSRRPFSYRARVYYAENSYSALRDGTWAPGAEIELFPGTAKQEFSHLDIWLDGECPCQVPDGAEGHWRVTFQIPRHYDVVKSVD